MQGRLNRSSKRRKEIGGGLGVGRGQKDRLPRAAEGTKYLIRPDQTHVAMIQSCKKTMRLTGRSTQLKSSRLATCNFKCGHFQSCPPC